MWRGRFFEAPARRTICVELPEEQTHEGDDGGLLIQSFHGTVDASDNFQEEVRKVLTKAGFKRGKHNPSTYYREKVGMMAMVHGDHLISSGSRKSSRWIKQVLESRFEVSTVVVGDGRDEEVQETKVLIRMIRMDHDGWHYEADQRHGELLALALNLQGAEEKDRQRLNNQDATQHRALAARVVLALDRPDVQYAVKEICQGMSTPTRGDLR